MQGRIKPETRPMIRMSRMIKTAPEALNSWDKRRSVHIVVKNGSGQVPSEGKCLERKASMMIQ
jgi:hypothetical protein